MTEIHKEILSNKQNLCELVEIGVVRAAGVLVRETFERVEDDALTLQNVKNLAKKLNDMLQILASAREDFDGYKAYVEQSEEKSNNPEVKLSA